ncbi:hypothetical protein B0H11DRAFT_2193979 [Mycena galericulata]|nr:hypothetical protein B0H11DRAFT_2193979 [Mycena galericulata]
MFFRNLRRLSVLFVSGCAYMASVDSPLSSVPSSPAFPVAPAAVVSHWLSPFLGPFFSNNTSNTSAVLSTPAIVDVPHYNSIVALDSPQVMSAIHIDWGDFDFDTLETFLPAWLAVAHTARTDPARIWCSIVEEGVKTMLYLGGMEYRSGFDLGDEVETAHKLLTSVVLRFALNLIVGTAAAILASGSKRLAKIPFGRIAQELDVWALGQFQCLILNLLVYGRVRLLALHIGWCTVLVICLGSVVSRFLSRYPPAAPPPPPKKKKKRYYQPARGVMTKVRRPGTLGRSHATARESHQRSKARTSRADASRSRGYLAVLSSGLVLGLGSRGFHVEDSGFALDLTLLEIRLRYIYP